MSGDAEGPRSQPGQPGPRENTDEATQADAGMEGATSSESSARPTDTDVDDPDQDTDDQADAVER